MKRKRDHNEGGEPAEELVLGIETSCDECAAAVVAGAPGRAAIVSNVVLSQVDLHGLYGGVVPELAARAHADTIDRVVAEALQAAGVPIDAVSAVAATSGPGLLGGLLVGSTFAKALARGAGTRFVAVNHLEAHILTPRLTHQIPFPYLVALMSGGHALFVAVAEPGQYRRLGGTIDDAAGEAFDKTAKLLGLPYPGGPAVERAAASGDPHRFAFPLPLAKRDTCDLSFAGLKTAVRLAAERSAPLTTEDVADICASFQHTVAASLAKKTAAAFAAFAATMGEPARALAVVGGVAANASLREVLSGAARDADAAFVAPPPALCTDNGAMVAYAAIEALGAGTALGSETRARSRWPLDSAAPAMIGGGKRGAKA